MPEQTRPRCVKKGLAEFFYGPERQEASNTSRQQEALIQS